MQSKSNRDRAFRIGAQVAISARGRKSLDQSRFLDLLQQMTPRDRCVVAALVGRVADTEARRGQAAALQLIDDIEAAIRTPDS